MNRTMMRELYEHLLAEPVKDNQVAALIKKIESELDNFPIAYISRSDIQRAGYESSTLSDEAVLRIAATMKGLYEQKSFDEDLYYAVRLEICSCTFLPECPNCFLKNTAYDLNTNTCYCKDCGYEWGLDESSEVSSGEFIRIEPGEGVLKFEDHLDCYRSREGAYYVTRDVYQSVLHHKAPEAPTFRLIYWPWSQAFRHQCGKGGPCERIEDKKAHFSGLKDGCMVPMALIEQKTD